MKFKGNYEIGSSGHTHTNLDSCDTWQTWNDCRDDLVSQGIGETQAMQYCIGECNLPWGMGSYGMDDSECSYFWCSMENITSGQHHVCCEQYDLEPTVFDNWVDDDGQPSSSANGNQESGYNPPVSNGNNKINPLMMGLLIVGIIYGM